MVIPTCWSKRSVRLELSAFSCFSSWTVFEQFLFLSDLLCSPKGCVLQRQSQRLQDQMSRAKYLKKRMRREWKKSKAVRGEFFPETSKTHLWLVSSDLTEVYEHPSNKLEYIALPTSCLELKAKQGRFHLQNGTVRCALVPSVAWDDLTLSKAHFLQTLREVCKEKISTACVPGITLWISKVGNSLAFCLASEVRLWQSCHLSSFWMFQEKPFFRCCESTSPTKGLAGWFTGQTCRRKTLHCESLRNWHP